MYNLVVETHFWSNFHQVQRQKIGKPGITFIGYAQRQKIGKPNNLKSYGAEK